MKPSCQGLNPTWLNDKNKWVTAFLFIGNGKVEQELRELMEN